MRTTATTTAIATRGKVGPPTSAGIPTSFHIAAAMWLVGMPAFFLIAPRAYQAFLQEDRFVEWWTVTLFGAAAFLRLRSAWRNRRVFDFLIGLFCFFVAGEEFSWGQRLLGFQPPALFLAKNTQQEFTLHNFADIFGQPKTFLMVALFGFGILMPIAQKFAARIGGTAPPRSTMPWFAAAIVILFIYPIELTGEWIEAFAGALFLVTAFPPQLGRWIVATATLALALTGFSAFSAGRDPRALACARAETTALLQDVDNALNEYEGLLHKSAHKRLLSAIEAGYLPAALPTFQSVQCPGEAEDLARQRHRFLIDPWGLAYWVRSEQHATKTLITVYSFGPNRRRDNEPGELSGDDVIRIGARLR